MAIDILRVSTLSAPTAVAGAIAAVIKEKGIVELHSVGASATNQAVKSVAIARRYLADDGIDLVCVPDFTSVTIRDEERTAMCLTVTPR